MSFPQLPSMACSKPTSFNAVKDTARLPPVPLIVLIKGESSGLIQRYAWLVATTEPSALVSPGIKSKVLFSRVIYMSPSVPRTVNPNLNVS